jgi:ElaB/YqjD/DUF883 family membrane-anchored ribosome-binding protein
LLCSKPNFNPKPKEITVFHPSTKSAANGKDRLKAAAGHAKEGARRVHRDASDAADDIRGDLSSAAHHMGEQFREFVDSASDGLSHAKDSVVEAKESVEEQISNNPWPAAVIALGAGMILGALLRRR